MQWLIEDSEPTPDLDKVPRICFGHYKIGDWQCEECKYKDECEMES